MIIQCDHCSAKFRMDDSKLANGPVKVRCAKCKEVFVVSKEDDEESFQVPAETGAASAASSKSETEQSGSSSGSYSGATDEFSFDTDEPAVKSAPASDESAESGSSDEFDWQRDESSVGAGAKDDFDLGEFSTGSLEQKNEAAAESGAGEFDFGDIPLPESSVTPEEKAGAPQSASDEFAIDFGEISFSDKPVDSEPESFDFSFAPTESSSDEGAEETVASQISGEKSSDDFELSFNVEPDDKTEVPVTASKEISEASFGDFDFGDAGEQKSVTHPVQSVSSLGSLSETPDVEDEFSPDTDPDELPPSSLSTRKKRGSLFPFLVILGAIVLIVALAGSGVYFFGGPKAFSKVGLGFLVEWYGQKSGEDGDISIRNVKAEYVVNKEAGELFVVRGEAMNNYKKPRASIQIKVDLLKQGGASLKGKTAFCGNPLSNEQLGSLPMTKIDEAMNNQFGDSLANLGVKPGNAIPFVVVINDIPKNAVDYSVQVGGSTVATQ